MEEKRYYLTKAGLDRIQKEYRDLLAFKKQKTMEDVPNILQSEDINSEYLVYQEDLHLLEAKIVEYGHILKHVHLITKPTKDRRDEVCMGATVVVEVDGETDEFQIVGTLEANPSEGRISNESPVGRALLGRFINEEAVVNSSVVVVYKVKKIRYS